VQWERMLDRMGGRSSVKQAGRWRARWTSIVPNGRVVVVVGNALRGSSRRALPFREPPAFSACTMSLPLTPVLPLNHSDVHQSTRYTTRLPRKDWLRRVCHASAVTKPPPSPASSPTPCVTAPPSFIAIVDITGNRMPSIAQIRTDEAGLDYALRVTIIFCSNGLGLGHY